MKKRVVALLCAVGLIIGGSGSIPAQAAKKPVSLSKTSITLKVGKSKTLKVIKSGKIKIRKKTFKTSNKKVATVTKKGKITAKKAGKATIKVTVKYKKGKKLKTSTLKCKVVVTAKNTSNRTATSKPSQKPVASPSADLTISSARELNEFAQKVNNGNNYQGKLIQMTQDIQFDGVSVNNFAPIAYADEFEGVFDGCGHIISGIDVTDSTGAYDYGAALFGKIGISGVVRNLTVSNSSFWSSGRASCIAGANCGTINNCHNNGVSCGSRIGAGYAAGIVAYNWGTVANCVSTGEISSSSWCVGGIVAANHGKIVNSCNLGSVISTREFDVDIGGVAGCNEGSVQNCYNVGEINFVSKDTKCYVGGITGENESTAIVANSYCSEESAESNFGTMAGVEKNCKALPKSDMQTETFLSLLNTNRGSNTDWLNWEIQSEGSIMYPLPGKAALSNVSGIADASISVSTAMP